MRIANPMLRRGLQAPAGRPGVGAPDRRHDPGRGDRGDRARAAGERRDRAAGRGQRAAGGLHRAADRLRGHGAHRGWRPAAGADRGPEVALLRRRGPLPTLPGAALRRRPGLRGRVRAGPRPDPRAAAADDLLPGATAAEDGRHGAQGGAPLPGRGDGRGAGAAGGLRRGPDPRLLRGAGAALVGRAAQRPGEVAERLRPAPADEGSAHPGAGRRGDTDGLHSGAAAP